MKGNLKPKEKPAPIVVGLKAAMLKGRQAKPEKQPNIETKGVGHG